ncbi:MULTISPECIES: bifunctional diaminohydroxyphosphoribosylaminopyrimidine deaminase/5-amino-6-(5-phosphoribosylamino)uracil reductase RibD [unclassified Crossiella]|uniref:bifunctional diaminohydroxyphosphoribosylaminopyrimidine deaminase/5-amino-6-(5-phosphoribosylamino)uracil reductase RibD n=1 Tax=unclassified Crossiella TaxID=2620835 RepID=UPI001FFE8613|nr:MULTISPECIES: bifunctional diaminohydroxyphosphoribosylaminopyrimidine deaminase/5-amino-6-(5-phosphoribosylamino)uracil reductase RibD [unclassified Crossiella]MCK2245487.1 bifunctional diaminohydroxyphosphoribosylaminopyrimidine deaminase/5-amino-6-(5-phosphoribosylamino)uracil reductase RibD [Crossiella sp. S99.2]MCK2259133.1 bifunctional diaminohydroxyphosphoribosylaminopyrimidine deaminase/5-amino-6-(5-phosphoribosylamino)uracil reductase RibD [Crossiella sp. S99.1]
MSPQDRLPLVEAMRTAIAASTAVLGTTSPNPPVGAVILAADGTVVGVGATQPAGGPHAEVMALREAGEKARGGCAVVTLEPCNHTGRTPPCVDGLLEAGVAEVHFAVADPNPKAAGGADRLRAHGVEVSSGLLEEQVRRGPLRAWLHYARTGRPHVTWKYAATLDGRVAAADSTSRWISSPESRAEVHELRRQVDAIMVGRGTVLADDPDLTARAQDGGLADRQPLRVVVGAGELPVGARVRNDFAETLHLRTHEPKMVLAELAARGVVDVLLEGGPRLAGAFVAAGLVDRVLLYLAPGLLGAGPAALAEAGVGTIEDTVRLQFEEVGMSGPDVRISAVFPRQAD